MQEIAEEVELLALPRGRKKERLAQKIEVIRKRDKISKLVFSKEAQEYFGEEYFASEQGEWKKKVGRCFLQEEIAYKHTKLILLCILVLIVLCIWIIRKKKKRKK